MKPVLILIFSAALLFLGSCRSQKPAATQPYTPEAQAPTQHAPADFAALCESYQPWSDVVMNVRLRLTQPSSFGASARVTMRRGQWIALSVRVLGFEVAAARIDADSVRGFVKPSKLYVSENVSAILSGGRVTVADLQDLLLGRVFLAGGGTLTPDMRQDFTMSDDQEFWSLEPRLQPAECQYGFAIDYDPSRLLATFLRTSRATAAVSYASAASTPFGTFASESLFTIAAQTSEDASRPLNVEASLRWDFDGAKWDTGADPAFKIPSSCRRVSTERLLKALSGLS